MLHLCVSDGEPDVESEGVVAQSGYYIISCLRRHDQEIIISAHFVGRFVDIWVQGFVVGEPRTLALQRFSEVKGRLRFIRTMAQGYLDTGWVPADIKPPRSHTECVKTH